VTISSSGTGTVGRVRASARGDAAADDPEAAGTAAPDPGPAETAAPATRLRKSVDRIREMLSGIRGDAD
jgi:hypothetical protein